MLEGRNGAVALPVVSVGDVVGGHVFEGLPDGLAPWRKGHTLQVYVNHEMSKVPFQNQADIKNAEVSRLTLNRDAGVVSAETVVPSALGYQRFCSNFIGDKKHGFKRPILFTNEEATDFVLRQEASWPTAQSEPPSEQAGMVVAHDIESGQTRSIPRMGRHNHENAVPLEGYKGINVLSGDDTFSAPSSQMYLYRASSQDEMWANGGHLFAFRSDVATVNDYGDIASGQSVSGRFIQVPDDIADGKPGGPTDGPQASLESWSNANNVFQFIRVEDIAYDRRDQNVIYFADTGEPRAVPQATADGRLSRGPSSFQGPHMNGRLWKMVLDRKDPSVVRSLSILPNGNFDAGGYFNPNVPHQPDNVETIPGAILFQEDPGSHQQTSASFPNATNARVWHYDLATAALTVVGEVDQSQDPAARKGSWESSGVVDVSEYYGAGAFLLDVEAHTRNLTGDPMARREDGQVLLLRLPKSLVQKGGG